MVKGATTRAIPAITGRINLPIGMILRCLPPAVLAADIAEPDGTGAPGGDVDLPMNMVLSQLPSGKVEMPLQELVPHIPAKYLKSAEALAPHLATLVSLPLMDVVMRIPPDLLALRPDQKDVDSSVVNMADPFTEEILREQAEAKKRQAQPPAQPNIIDENQVPAAEEFVPRDQAPPEASTKSFVPPPRPLAGSSIGKTSGMGVAAGPGSLATTPLPPGARTAAIPILPGVVRNSSPVPPPAPNSSSRRISPSGRLPAPVRAGSPFPMRAQGAPTTPVPLPPSPAGEEARSAPMAPPFPGSSMRPTMPLPTPVRTGPVPPAPQTPQPPLRPTVSLPPPPPVPPALPVAAQPSAAPSATSSTSAPPEAPASTPAGSTAAPASPAAFPLPGQPDAAAGELQRLAALAMQQLDSKDATSADKTAEPIRAPAASAVESDPSSIAAEAPPLSPPPLPRAESSPAVAEQPRAVANRSITAPTPPSFPAAPPPFEERPTEKPAAAADPSVDAPSSAAEPALAFNLNSCTTSDLIKIPGCSPALADSIVRQRTKIGSFKRIEDLLEVPGMNSAAYRNLTGEAPPQSGIPQSLAELLGFPEEQKITLKDVTDRICCWPDVTGCILGQSSGLSLVGTVPKNFDKAAIVAFAPRMFESVNKSFNEIAGKDTNELIIPTTGTSFHILRHGDLYLIILSRLPQMPDRHVKIARLVLAGLNQLPV